MALRCKLSKPARPRTVWLGVWGRSIPRHRLTSIAIIKIRRVHGRFILIMEIPVPGETVFILKRKDPWLCPQTWGPCGSWSSIGHPKLSPTEQWHQMPTASLVHLDTRHFDSTQLVHTFDWIATHCYNHMTFCTFFLTFLTLILSNWTLRQSHAYFLQWTDWQLPLVQTMACGSPVRHQAITWSNPGLLS